MEIKQLLEQIDIINENLNSLNERMTNLENMNSSVINSEQAARIESLESQLINVKNQLALIAESRPILYTFPVNKDGWTKQSEVFNSLEINGKVYSILASSTYGLEKRFFPHNLLTEAEGEQGSWASAANHVAESWITFCNPEAVTYNYLRIKARPPDRNQAPTKFEIRGSNDIHFLEGHYTIIKSYENIDYTQNIVKEFDFENTRKYIYYQLFVHETKSSVVGITELNFRFRLTPEYLANI